MNFKYFLKNLFINIKDGVSRFFVAFICSSLCFLTISFEIIFESGDDEIIVPLCMTYALVAVLSVLLKILQEYICKKANNIYQYTICIIVSIISYILIKLNYESLYTIMAYAGIFIALLCFIFFVIMRGENRDTAFPKIVASYVFATAIASVLSGGLSTCIAAFQSLIFTWDDIYKIYLIINLFVWTLGFVNVFLALIPKKDITVVQSKIFRIFVLFAMLPLYILLIAILLIYLAKIVITQNMPVGEINWFASFASLFFIFLLMSVMQYTDKLARLFVKFGGYFLIPVLVMQAIAVFERINAYGLTTPRTISLTLIIISVLFIIGSVVIPKHLNKIALASGIIVLFVTITPFNVIDMPISSQTNILRTTLENNDMLKDGVIVPNENISEADTEKIISSYEYLKYNADQVPDFIENKKKSTEEIFGFTKEENNETRCVFETKDIVDITDYNTMVMYETFDNDIKFDYDGNQYNIDLIPIAESLYKQYGSGDTSLDSDIYIVNKNIALSFENLRFDMENNTAKYFHFNGCILLK